MGTSHSLVLPVAPEPPADRLPLLPAKAGLAATKLHSLTLQAEPHSSGMGYRQKWLSISMMEEKWRCCTRHWPYSVRERRRCCRREGCCHKVQQEGGVAKIFI